MSYWNDLERHVPADAFWMGHPLIRAWINERVAGDASVWPTRWFADHFGDVLREGDILSIGCGTGSLERDLAGLFPQARITGIDTSERAIATARLQAEKEGLEHAVTYKCADAWIVLQKTKAWDGIFFHASLHHFDRLQELLRLVADALRPKGLLYLDEYVGPAMTEWNVVRLGMLNVLYYLLPRRARRVGVIRTPLNPDDPTEAICSSQILPAVRQSFEILERRDYGGNVTALIFPNLQLAADRVVLTRAVQRLLRIDRFLLDRLHRLSYHTVLVGTPSKGERLVEPG